MNSSSTFSLSHSRPKVTSLLIPAPQSNQPLPRPSAPGIRQSIDVPCGSSTGSQTRESRPLPESAKERKDPTPPSDLPPRGTPDQATSSPTRSMQQRIDSGVRLPPAVAEIPPPYSEA